ncbi:hypothetical protein, partial [Oleiphilus sp. HI0117]|uniref:hypothetical protein n=1 Tax=Oleiphilus sp. HI0117 TaxID=1822261 RepID=UPI000A53D9BF
MRLLILTNLYPLPWEPNRATFNKQQFDRLARTNDVSIIVPVSWLDYLMHRAEIKKANSPKLLYVCYWYTPKILYSFFGWFMWLSVLIGLNSHFRGFRPEVVLGSWAYPDGFAAAQLAKRFDC